MSVPVGLNHPFNVFTMSDQTTREDWVGGSYDNVSAVTVASAVYQARQGYSTTQTFLVGVFDDTDTCIAMIGHLES